MKNLILQNIHARKIFNFSFKNNFDKVLYDLFFAQHTLCNTKFLYEDKNVL